MVISLIQNKGVQITSTFSYLEVLASIFKVRKINFIVKYDYFFKGFKELKVVSADFSEAQLGAYISSKYGTRTPDVIDIGYALSCKCGEFLTSDKSLGKIEEMKVIVL